MKNTLRIILSNQLSGIPRDISTAQLQYRSGKVACKDIENNKGSPSDFYTQTAIAQKLEQDWIDIYD